MSALPGINPAAATLSKDDAQLQKLNMISTRGQSGKMKESEMRDVANQFENMVFRMLMKEMRKTVPENGLIEKSHSTKMYEQIADDYLVEELTKSTDLGIEGVIFKELVERNKNIVDPAEIKEQPSEFKPVNSDMIRKDELRTEDFIALPQPHTKMIGIHNPTPWIDIPQEKTGPIPIRKEHMIPSNKIDNSL